MVVVKKAISLAPNTYYYRGYFLYHLKYKDDTWGWLVYNKFEEAACQDFIFEAKNLPALVMAINLFKEELETPLVPEVAPEGDTT